MKILQNIEKKSHMCIIIILYKTTTNYSLSFLICFENHVTIQRNYIQISTNFLVLSNSTPCKKGESFKSL